MRHGHLGGYVFDRRSHITCAQCTNFVPDADGIRHKMLFMLMGSGTNTSYVDEIRHKKMFMLMASGTNTSYVDGIRHKKMFMLMASGTNTS